MPQQKKPAKDVIEFDRLISENPAFIHSEEIKNNENNEHDIRRCISIFRTLQAITDESKKPIPGSPIHFNQLPHNNQSISFKTEPKTCEPTKF